MPWLTQALALALASLLVAGILQRDAMSLAPGGAVLLLTAVPTLLAPLFLFCAVERPRELRGSVLGWALVVLLLAGIAWLVFGVRLAWQPLALASLVGLGILLVSQRLAAILAASMRGIGVEAGAAADGSAWLVTSLLWLAASTPLWLGPVADLGARQQPALPTFVLASSPLAHFAAAAGHDVLRGEWFYGHSSLGSLQVDYPRVGTVLGAYALLAVMLSLLLVPLRRWSGRAASRPAGGVMEPAA